MPRRLQLVVNPAAGGGRAARLLPRVEATLRAAGHDLLVSTTRALEDADALTARSHADGRVVVAMGGDGLVGRVAGAAALTGGLMALLPGGRGNDFARAVGMPAGAVAACGVLDTGVETAVDLGRAGEAAFLGIASIGFDSAVQERVLAGRRLPRGRPVYLAASLATVAGWRPASFRCTVDGVALELTGWSVAVANSGVYGGGMRLAPDASVTDGLLDVVTTSSTSRVRFLRSLPSVFRGAHVRQASVTVVPARVVQLDADRPFRVFADGDPVASLPCTVTVEPGAVRCLLPA